MAVALTTELARAIRADRARQARLVDRRGRVPDQRPTGRGEDEPAGAGPGGLIQRDEGSAGVHLEVLPWLGDRIGDAAEGGEMDHRFNSLCRSRDGIGVANVTFQDLDPRHGDAFATSEREVVEDAHVATALEQHGDEVRADEATPAGDERPHAEAW
jgi:hypothetical protein